MATSYWGVDHGDGYDDIEKKLTGNTLRAGARLGRMKLSSAGSGVKGAAKQARTTATANPGAYYAAGGGIAAGGAGGYQAGKRRQNY